jgi:alpha-mannosidase
MLKMARLDGKAVVTETRFEQRIGEPFIRVRIDFDNPCDDQRVRVHVPVREPADSSLAEGQFAVVERGLEVEGGYGEVAVPTLPASAFVAAGGIALLLDHVTEYELVNGELALTVLRSIGYISRNDNPWREDPAGPELPIPAAQLHGPCRFAFAYYPSTASAHEQAERYRHRFLTGRSKGAADELRTHSGPALEGNEAVVLTCLQADRARVVNESAKPRTATFAGERLDLGPWEIRTFPLAVR